jgi:hypothetical protein
MNEYPNRIIYGMSYKHLENKSKYFEKSNGLIYYNYTFHPISKQIIIFGKKIK